MLMLTGCSGICNHYCAGVPLVLSPIIWTQRMVDQFEKARQLLGDSIPMGNEKKKMEMAAR